MYKLQTTKVKHKNVLAVKHIFKKLWDCITVSQTAGLSMTVRIMKLTDKAG